MVALRKKSDVWKGVDDERPSTLGQKAWRQSYEGVTAAIRSLGLQMVTSQEEFDQLEIPLEKRKDGHTGKQYMYRKIVVERDGNIGKPTRINDMLNGKCCFLTETEVLAANARRSQTVSAKQGKGTTINGLSEMKASADLDAMICVDTVLRRIPLIEFRLSDIAYSLIDEPLDGETFVADQVKSSQVDKAGCLHFKHAGNRIKVSRMIEVLETGSTLTCIGKNEKDEPDVVWFFDGLKALHILSQFPGDRTFHPRLHLKCTSPCAFTNAMNKPEFRFEVGDFIQERTRLLKRKLDAVINGRKHSVRFLNEHASQITGLTHRIEHESFVLIRAACGGNGACIERFPEDAYSQVDFRLDTVVKIQDKVAGLFRTLSIRPLGRHPLNPDNIDVLQVTDLKNKLCYVIPMRVVSKEGQIVSRFTEQELMKHAVHVSKKWLRTLAKFDLTDTEDIKSYIKACHDAHLVPPLSNRNFYRDILQRNTEKFGPPHKFYNKGAKKAPQVLT